MVRQDFLGRENAGKKKGIVRGVASCQRPASSSVPPNRVWAQEMENK